MEEPKGHLDLGPGLPVQDEACVVATSGAAPAGRPPRFPLRDEADGVTIFRRLVQA